MSLETALRARLKADAGVSAITPRVDWTVRPQGSILPCIVLTLVSDDRSQHMAGFDTFRSTRVQIDCYAATAKDAADLREAVIACVVPAGIVSGTEFLRGFVNTVLDRGDQTDTGFIHRQLIDLSLWHNA